MTERDNRAIVVGVDGSHGSKAALAFALAEGLARGATVEVVTTWLLGPAISDIATATTFEEEQGKAQRTQDAALAEVLAGFSEKPAISRVVLQSYGGHALVDAAHDAAMLVVGSGRKSMLARALLGSVSEYCVRHARVPVVVVPDPGRLEAEKGSEEIVEVTAAPE
ncbi:MAG TPA: universal stress protein [Marmoricola sp.]|jgi:nucleotide-binding universal stress UspA family protein|nr:universal stress protein [Marmoricola sp.]